MLSEVASLHDGQTTVTDRSRNNGQQGVDVRRVAAMVLGRVEEDGAYANLVLRRVLDDLAMNTIDAKLVTDLVYGTLRRQRSCDFLVGRFMIQDPPPTARVFLRLGAYQIAFRPDIPDYAAVSATVSAAPKRFRGLCNAVLRKVASAPIEYPSEGDRLSYPDWIVEQLVEDLGSERALGALESMNEPATQTTRSDGYTQDPASQMVVDLVGVQDGDLVADLCASPGGKATGLAARGAMVVAGDLADSRVHLLAGNAARYGRDGVMVMQADAVAPGLRPASLDRILLDAPCSGLGMLRRRPDARWRMDRDAPQRLATLQKRMIDAVVPLLVDGGVLVYSVCTLTKAETVGVDDHIAVEHPNLVPLEPPEAPWEPFGRGSILLPQTEGTDGMCVFRYRYSR